MDKFMEMEKTLKNEHPLGFWTLMKAINRV